MIKQTLYLSAALALSLASCTGSDTSNDTAQAENTLPITATYAFKASSEVKAIAASPNDVASWLGAIAVLGDNGYLRFSDIESVSSKAVSGNYNQIIGFDRPGAPALFAAVNEAGTWRGFLESSSTFDFSPAAIVGAPGKDAVICAPHGAATTTLKGVSGGALISYSVTISEDGILSLAAADSQSIKIAPVDYCAASPDGSVLVGTAKGLSRFAPDGTAVAKTKSVYMSAAFLDESTLIGVSHGKLFEIDAATLDARQQLSIKSGLSILGIENAGRVFVTPSPYGGAAFDDGVVFVTDADAPRVVAISRRFFLAQLNQIN